MGNFRERKLSQMGRKGAFHRENFRGMLNWLHNGCGMPKISWRKLLRVAVKSRNLWRFSLSKVSHYMVLVSRTHTYIPTVISLKSLRNRCFWGQVPSSREKLLTRRKTGRRGQHLHGVWYHLTYPLSSHIQMHCTYLPSMRSEPTCVHVCVHMYYYTIKILSRDLHVYCSVPGKRP